jgi:hypothetical protein
VWATIQPTYDMDVDAFNMANNGIVTRRALANEISYPADDDFSVELDLPYNGYIDQQAWVNHTDYDVDAYSEALLDMWFEDEADRAYDADNEEESELDFEGETENRSVWNDEDGDFSNMYLN